MPPGPAVVWAYRRTGKFAFHALTGALETDPRTKAVPLTFANGVAAVIEAIRGALAGVESTADDRPARCTVLVGWSFYSPDFARMTGELHAVKDAIQDPRVVHIAGGVHATAEPLATLRAGFDLVAVGEGELLIRELVATLGAAGDLRAVPGIAWLDESGELQRNGRGARPVLDDFPPFGPDHDRFGPIEITRGCVYACRFCQTPYFAGAAFRHRSVANVRQWVRYLVGRGFRDLRFLTPTSLSYGAAGAEPDLAAVEALLAGVREEIGPGRKLWFGTFPSEVRPEHVTAAALMLIARHASNRTLILGGQSGSDRVLAASERGHDSATVERAAALCVEHGFVPHVDFLFGLPGEDAGDIEATLGLMDRLVARGARVHGHTFMPLPGTPLRRAAPGAIDAATRRRLLAMQSRGALYGQWQQQERLARELAGDR
ncbi:MAG: TIGR04013 family B12-binding domain/radical SAM domain-containing protein [Planctomycetes bacterium]|nr:TIGR04013 family B12-binding domain/radical SAM domain-containing protein [Planctomycetota bacterium]